MKYHIEKNTVQETLVIPLYGRKMCSELYPNLFRDETAVRLINEIDYDFSTLARKSQSMMQQFGFLECAMRQSDLACEVRDYLREKLGDKHIKMRESNGQRVPIVPIYTYEEIPTLTIAKDLYEHGVYVNSSLPPAAVIRLRLSLPPHTASLVWLGMLCASASARTFLYRS